MGKKVSQISQSSVKICKNDKKQMNSLIKVLRPKVYITESSNFKRLVQELTGNGNHPVPIPIPAPIPFQMPYAEPAMQVPVVEIHDDHDLDQVSYQEPSLDSSMDSSEASMAQEFCISDALFSANVFDQNKVDLELDFPAYGDIDSWLLESENSFSYINNCCEDVNVFPTIQQQVGVYSYDLSDLMI